jgi:hypothetical protein
LVPPEDSAGLAFAGANIEDVIQGLGHTTGGGTTME